MSRNFYLTILLSLLSTSIINDVYAQERVGSGVSVSPSRMRFSVEAGGSKSQKLTINNDTKKVNKFKVVFHDFDMNGKGKTPFLPAGEGKYSLSRWTTVSPSFIELQPFEKKEITVTLNIPAEDSMANIAAWSILTVEQVEERTDLDPGRGDGNTIAMGVVPTYAFGIYLYQNPPNAEITRCEIINMSINQNETSRFLLLDVENKGDGVSYCTATIEYTHLQTGETEKALIKQFTIVPELIRDFKYVFPEGLKGGDYSAAVVLDYGSDEEIEVAEINFKVE